MCAGIKSVPLFAALVLGLANHSAALAPESVQPGATSLDSVRANDGTNLPSPHAGLPSAACELQKLSASDASQLDHFGASVALSGDTAMVGASGDDCPGGLGTDCGTVYVYRRVGTTWLEEQKLTAFDATEGASFGAAVSLSSERAIIGAWTDGCALGSLCGSAYVYRRDGTTWVHEQKLTASDAAPGDRFGVAVHISGSRALVGASGDDCPGLPDTRCGSAYIYRHDATGWVEEQMLTPGSAASHNFFGTSVSVSGEKAIVGAVAGECPGSPDNSYCGSAYVYRYEGTTWILEQMLSVLDASLDGQFGGSVALSGDTAVVGASLDDYPAGTHSGSAYVYRYDGKTWMRKQKLTPSDGAPYSHFGDSVSISGNRIIVGSSWDDCAVGIRCGSAYVYRHDGTSWHELQKLTAADPEPEDRFGTRVALAGDTAIVGAAGDRCSTGAACGAAYIFAVGPDCQPNGIPDACDINDGVSQDDDGDEVPDECETGACCDRGPGGGCSDGRTQAECGCAGCEWFASQACSEVDCRSAAIPTAGAWGLAVLGLVLISGGKVVFRKGRIDLN